MIRTVVVSKEFNQLISGRNHLPVALRWSRNFMLKYDIGGFVNYIEDIYRYQM